MFYKNHFFIKPEMVKCCLTRVDVHELCLNRQHSDFDLIIKLSKKTWSILQISNCLIPNFNICQFSHVLTSIYKAYSIFILGDIYSHFVLISEWILQFWSKTMRSQWPLTSTCYPVHPSNGHFVRCNKIPSRRSWDIQSMKMWQTDGQPENKASII